MFLICNKCYEFKNNMRRKFGSSMGRVDTGADFHNIEPDDGNIFKFPYDCQSFAARDAAGYL